MSGRHARVLVCDDEPQILRALRVVLREADFDTDLAETAEQALDLASVKPPDAAIIDLVLPDGDGTEVCRSLREWSRMPIIVLSAVGDEEEKVRALEAGADDYVVKPFAPRELVARLEAVLRRVKPEDEECSVGGKRNITLRQLREPSGRGECHSLSDALAHSANAVFARLERPVIDANGVPER